MNSWRLCSESNWELDVSYYSMKQLVFSVLGTIKPLNSPMWYYALANEICKGKPLTHLSWSCFILGNKYLFIELYKI